MGQLLNGLRQTLSWLVFFLALGVWPGAQADQQNVVVAVPGPGSLSYLPVELISSIGADRAEGIVIRPRYFSGGPLAYRDMLEGRCDFAVAGAPALAELAAKGEPVVSIAAVSRVPSFVLMVSQRLKDQVKKVADLRGRVIGIHTSSAQGRSTAQLMAEHLLQGAGVDPEKEVSFLAAGQSLAESMAAFDSGAIDALISDEPFASRLRASGRAFYLLDLHDAASSGGHLKGEFLYAQLATRRDVLATQADKAARVVRALRRTLRWIAAHTPEEIAAKIAPDDAEARRLWTGLLRRHKGIYSPDGAFTREQIRTAETFFRANQAPDSAAARFEFMRMIDPRFVGLRLR